MARHLREYRLRVACLAVLLASVHVCSAQPKGTPAPAAAPAGIPESKIAALEAALPKRDKRASSVRQRRACKSFVRRAEGLLGKFPAAPNRYRVLGAMLKTQKLLLTLEASARDRATLFDICTRLAQAPDEYADIRLEADLLLSERDLAAKGATLQERAKALATLVERYRGTPAEAKSLMMAALIAPKLEAFDLQNEILDTMAERFAGDPVVIAWRRKNFLFAHFDMLFKGTFKRADGVSLSFPIDAMGHTCLMVFWSRETPDFEAHLAAIKELQSRCPGRLKIYSFNLDQLPDAGAKTLRARGLNWTALHLPGGRQSQTYRTYVTRDPLGLRVNAHGHVLVLSNSSIAIAKETPLEQHLDDVRYLAQLQSLFIGEFLVTDTDVGNRPSRTPASVPAETLDAIQACFTTAPTRYRQSQEQALANHTKAEKLCRDAIARYPKAPDLWILRNRRIIALLGMWNLATEPKHLEDAVKEARIALTATLPRGADVVPRFCLAKEALRRGDSDPESVLSALIKATGATDAPASAYAAAAILAMDANARKLHNRYRKILLEAHTGSPTIWPVVSFLRDQNHTFRLFKANYYHPPSWARRVMRGALRRNAAALDAAADANRLLKAELKTLAGGTLSLPQATDGKLTLLMFVEPPADPGADFPAAINGTITEDSRGRRIEIPGVMQHAFQLADQHIHKKIKVIAALLCDDAARVKTLMKKCKWSCQVAMVPDGLKNPLVRRLGILWADRVPNIVLLRGDGTIAWTISGLVHPQLKSEGVGELRHVIDRAMKANINVYEMEGSLRALKQGEFPEAVRLFSGPFRPPKRPSPDGWTAPRLHGRALAYMGLKNWEAALAGIDAAIDAHLKVYSHGKAPCDTTAEMRLIRATILEQLGRKKEAQAERKSAAVPTVPHSRTRYGLFHEKLKKFRLAQQ